MANKLRVYQSKKTQLYQRGVATHSQKWSSISLLLLFLLTTFTPVIDTAVFQQPPSVKFPSTRHNAVRDFVAALQMPEGAFINKLTHARAEQRLGSCRNAALTLRVLNAFTVIDSDAMIDFAIDRQLADGGFVDRMDFWETGLRDSGYAVRTLGAVNAVNLINRPGLGEFLMSCYLGNGGFNGIPGSSPLYGWILSNTEDAVACLVRTDQLHRVETSDIVDFVMERYCTDGGFAWNPGEDHAVLATYYALSILSMLDEMDEITSDLRSATLDYVMIYYNTETGGFFEDTLARLIRPILILQMLDGLSLVNATKTTELVFAHQSHRHGGFVGAFSNVDDAAYEELHRTREAVVVLDALGTLGALDEPFTVDEAPVHTGDNTPPTLYTPPPPPPFTLTPDILGMLILVTAIGSTFAIVIGYIVLGRKTTRKKKVKKVRRKRRR